MKNIQKSEETKRKLIETFFQLSEQKSIEKITIQEITDKSGVHRATFYRHFYDIYALREYEEDYIFTIFHQDVVQSLKTDSGIVFDVKRLKNLLFPFYEKCGPHLFALLGEYGDPAFQRRVKDTLEAAFYQVLQLQQPTAHEQYLIRFIISGIVTTLCTWHQKQDIPFDELIQYMHSQVSGIIHKQIK